MTKIIKNISECYDLIRQQSTDQLTIIDFGNNKFTRIFANNYIQQIYDSCYKGENQCQRGHFKLGHISIEALKMMIETNTEDYKKVYGSEKVIIVVESPYEISEEQDLSQKIEGIQELGHEIIALIFYKVNLSENLIISLDIPIYKVEEEIVKTVERGDRHLNING